MLRLKFPNFGLTFSINAETENEKPPEFRGNGNGTGFPHSPGAKNMGTMGERIINNIGSRGGGK